MIFTRKTHSITEEITEYKFATPWIALNTDNYLKYNTLDKRFHKKLLEKILTGNLLSMMRGIGCTIDYDLYVKINQFKQLPIIAHKHSFSGFYASFVTNLSLPQYIGIGKSVSKGFGMLERKLIIEITTHGTNLRRRRERFLVKTPDQKDVEIDAEKVEAIIINANAMISTAAIKLCVERQVQMVVASWSGQPIARMWSSKPGRQTQIRRQQYFNYTTPFAFETTKKLLVEKLSKQKKFLAELKQNRESSPLTCEITKALSSISATINEVKTMEYKKEFGQKFLGYEGSCAAKYFEMIAACLPKKWQFERRSQNPGLDPFNVCLNYMYGITYQAIEKIVILSGLDPTAGFYHKDAYAKPTLVFDLIEPCRPIIDKALIYLFSRKIVKDEWFEYAKDASRSIILSKQARVTLINAYKDNCQMLVEKQTWKRCRDISQGLLDIDNRVEKSDR